VARKRNARSHATRYYPKLTVRADGVGWDADSPELGSASVPWFLQVEGYSRVLEELLEELLEGSRRALEGGGDGEHGTLWYVMGHRSPEFGVGLRSVVPSQFQRLLPHDLSQPARRCSPSQ